MYLLASEKIYKPMCWWYTAHYSTMYCCDVVGCSSSDVTSGALQV